MNSKASGLIKGLKKDISASKNICILTHYNPDGDAIGSMLGLYWYLFKKGFKANLIVPNDFPPFLKWLPGAEEIIVFNKSQKDATSLLKASDIIFCMDFNSPDRINDMALLVSESAAIKVLIDHHPEPDASAKYTFSEISSSSTAELLYDIIQKLDGPSCFDTPLAECIYTGILTDTGCFSYNFTGKTLEIASKLLNEGIDQDKIYANIYDNYSEMRMKFLGYCLNEKMAVLKKYNTAYISITKEEMKRFSFVIGDTEGFVNYPLSIRGMKLSAFFAESSDHIKISFRSKKNFYVNRFSELHFEGGGHKNAAGGKSFLSLEETIRKFVNLLPEYANDLK